MKPLEDAQREVLAAVPLLPERRVSLREARGLALVESAEAPHDIPPFANSAMDGFAVRAADVAPAPVDLEVVEDVPAGSVPQREVGPGTAIAIMTGAPLPAGADAVVKVEDTERNGGRVRILEGVPTGMSIRGAGDDVRAGDEVLPAGTRLDAPELALLAAVGVAEPLVRRRPIVGIMSTGDEVVRPETQELQPGSIRDTNRPLLRALLEDVGAVVADFGIVPDDPDTLRKVLAHAAGECDVVVTSGGVSMGDYDLVKQVLGEIGDVEFWKVAMKPAKPFAFGALGDAPMFGLPGNPVSVMVAFEQFLRPALLTMLGASRVFRPRIPAVAGVDLSTDPEKTVFLRVATSVEEGRLLARPSGGQGSHQLSALAGADAFAVVPRGTATVTAGTAVDIELFRARESRTAASALGDGGS